MRFLNSKTLGRSYYKFQIGFGPMSYILTFIGFLTFAKVWQDTFEFYNIPFTIALVGIPIVILLTAIVIGHLMITKNIQSEMTSLVNREGNPEFVEVCDGIKTIIKNQQDIMKKVR